MPGLKSIHVKRIIGCAKTLKILKKPLNSEHTCMGGRIVYMCALCKRTSGHQLWVDEHDLSHMNGNT